MASPGGNPPDAGPLKGGKPDPKSENGPPEPGCGKGFPEAGWGFGGGGCGIGDGYTYGDGLDRKKGDGYGETAGQPKPSGSTKRPARRNQRVIQSRGIALTGS